MLNIGQEVYYVHFTNSSKVFSVTESYSINNVTVEHNFKVGEVLGSFDILEHQFPKRRSNFHVLEIKGILAFQEPYVYIDKVEPIAENSKFEKVAKARGFFINIMQLIEKQLNVSIDLFKGVTRDFGTVYPNGVSFLN